MATPPPSSPLRDVSYCFNTPPRHTRTMPTHLPPTPSSSPLHPKRWLESSPPIANDDVEEDPFVQDQAVHKRVKFSLQPPKRNALLEGLLKRETRGIFQPIYRYNATCVQTTRLHGEAGHDVVPFSCHYSSDGRVLAVAAEDGYVRLYNNQHLVSFKAHDNSIFHAMWCHRDQNMVTCSGDQSARVWNVEKQVCIAQLRGHTATVKCSSVHAEQPAVLATCSRDGRVMLWDLRCSSSVGQVGEAPIHRPTKVIQAAHPRAQPTKRRTTLQLPPYPQMNQSVTSVVFLAHNSHHLMTSGSVDDVIKCWDWRSLGFTSKSGPRPIMSSTSVNKQCGLSWLAQDAQGRFVYAVSTANRIHQYSAQHLGQPLRTFTAPDYAVRSFYVRAAVHPQGHLLAAGSSNGRLYVWDTTRLFSTNEPLCTLNTDTTNEVSGVDWQDEQTLASVSDDALLRVWR